MGDDIGGPERAAWMRKAQYEGLSCVRCGNTPEYDDREEFFESELCGWCASQSQKD